VTEDRHSFVKALQVEHGRTSWRAEDVPLLTASALHHFEPKPDPLISKTEIRRLADADGRSRAAGTPLNAGELALLAEHCAETGLPELPDALPATRWDEYLHAFNHDAFQRGWWAGYIPPRDPHDDARQDWHIAVLEHRKLLKAALKDGKVLARVAGTLMPAEPGMVALDRLVLTRTELQRFAALLAIQVVDMPHFISSAWPQELPAELMALADDAQVSYEHSIGRERGSGITNAAAYRGMIRETMARQSQGYFTVNEAAQVVAESRPGGRGPEWAHSIQRAHRVGVLAIREPGSLLPMRPLKPEPHSDIPKHWTGVQSLERAFSDLLLLSELDAWLRATAGYGFPAAGAAGAAATPAAAIETPKQRRARLLELHDAEVSAGRERGALARITEIERRARPSADRSNLGKEIRKARAERDAERRGGAFFKGLG
jgi:hypothetical protein